MRPFLIALALLAPPALAQTPPAAPPPPAVTVPADPELAAIVRDRLAWIAGGGNSITEVTRLQPQAAIPGGPGPTLRRADPEARTIATAALGEALKIARDTRSQALIVARGGRIELEWYAEGFSPASLSSTASMMKPVMALAMGQAIAQGHVKSVDDPIGRYISEWRDDPRGAITVRQVLQMSAGLAMAPSAPFLPGDITLGTDLTGAALSTASVGAPGEAFQYSNIVSTLGGLVIERATGKPFATFVSESVWAPLGAGDAAGWMDRPDGIARPYCCLIATARDWLRVGQLFLDDGRVGRRQVIPADWMAQMVTPSPRNPNFGYQLWLAQPHAPMRSYGPAVAFRVPAREAFLAPDMAYFDGAGGQRVYWSKAQDLVIVRIGAVPGLWDDSALPNAIARGLRP